MRKPYAFREKNYHHFADILFYTCEMFVASLVQHFLLAKGLFRDLQPRTFQKVLTIVCFCINLIRERTVGNPAIEGQTVNIKNLRTGLWSTLGEMLNEFAYEFWSLAATKRPIRLVTTISQVFEFFDGLLFCTVILFVHNNTTIRLDFTLFCNSCHQCCISQHGYADNLPRTSLIEVAVEQRYQIT